MPKSENGDFVATAVVPEPPHHYEVAPPGKVNDDGPPLMQVDADRQPKDNTVEQPPTSESTIRFDHHEARLEDADADMEMQVRDGQPHGSVMTPHQTRSQADNNSDHSGSQHGADHGHDRPSSILTALASGVINYLLMFGLCSAFGMILFENNWDAQHRALGVKLNLLTSLILGLLLASKSKICVAIGGPDLTPVVFLGSFVNVIAKDIAEQLQLDYPDVAARRLSEGYDRYEYPELFRQLGGGGDTADVEFCNGSHLTDENRHLCEAYHEQLTATVIFCIMVSSFSLGVIFFSLGRFRLTRHVSYVPTSIMEAFLSCVGYKVFKYALAFCRNDPQQFIPAACVGVPLYFVKAMHLGNPALVIPTMLFVPLIGFYIWTFAVKGSDLDQARKDQLMFPKMENIEFWELWNSGVYGKMSSINTQAWSKTVPDLIMMIVVCLLDCLLKLSSTETKLPISVDKDYEIQLHGLGNFMTTICGASVGYMQLKFNVVNYGVMGNIRDRRGGAIYALLCGAGFFGSMAHINYLPRFFLGILLFFAGAGFVAENLWGSRKYLSFHEWMQIFVIVGVFVLEGKLLYAVLAGGLLTGMDFIVRYARVPCTSGNPMRGGELVSKERHGPILQRNLQHIANSWLLVIKLKGYLFFASAQRLTQYVREEIQKQSSVPAYRRLKYIGFDCQLLDGMDASASKAMKKLVMEAKDQRIRIVWSHVTDKFIDELKNRKILEGDWNAFKNLDEVKSYVEDKTYQYLTDKQQRWIGLHPAFQLRQELMRMQHAFEPFDQIFVVDAVRRGCPWQYCGALQIKEYQTQLWAPGERNQDLFLVHSGAVGIFVRPPSEDVDEPCLPEAIYRHGWFLNTNQLIRAPTRNYAVCIQDGEVLFWNEQQWSRMARECPFMASAMAKLVMKQQVLDTDLDSKVSPVHDLPPVDEDLLQEEEKPFRTSHSDSAEFVRRSSHTRGSGEENRDSNVDDRRAKSVHAGAEREEHGIGDGRQQNSNSSLDKLERRHSEGSGLGNLQDNRSTQRKTMMDMFRWGSNSENTRNSKTGVSPETEFADRESRQSLRRPSVANGVLANVLPWLDEDRTNEVSKFREVRSAASLTIPEQLQVRLEGIQTAQVMDRYRLYESVSSSSSVTLPGLPRSFRSDLEIAFFTYSQVDANGSPCLLAKVLPQALMYAGVFNTLLKPRQLDSSDGSCSPVGDRRLNLKEFMQIGHEAVMASLSKEQETKIEQIFTKYDYDGSGDFNRDELVGMFRQMFHPDISIEEVDGIANAWDDELTGKINFEQFKAIMSHLIREHEQDWCLLLGFRDLLGVSPGDHRDILMEDTLSVEAMMKNCKCHPKLTREEAEELLWVADWRLHGTRGDALEFADVVAAVVLDLNLPRGCPLPPRPKIPEAARRGTMITSRRMAPPAPNSESKSFSIKERSVAVHAKHIVDIRDMNVSFATLSGRMQEAGNELTRAQSTAQQRMSNLVLRHEEKCTPILNHAMHNHNSPMLKGDNAQDEDFGVRAKILLFIEEPKSSLAANYFSLVMGLMIIVSVLTLVLEPLTDDGHRSHTEEDVWKGFEIFFTALFTIELLVRFCVADALGTQTMGGFCRQPGNICDFVAILPFYVELAVGQNEDQFRLLRIARLMRLSRVIKIAKLANRSSLFGPVAMVLTVIWGIYLKNVDSGK